MFRVWFVNREPAPHVERIKGMSNIQAMWKMRRL